MEWARTRLLRSRLEFVHFGEKLRCEKTLTLVGQAVSPAHPYQCLNIEEDCRTTIRTMRIYS